MDNQGSIPTKKAKRVKYSKSTRQRLRKRRQLLQDEFDRQGLNLVATFKDVTGCPSFKERQRKSRAGPKILSNVALENKYEFRDLGNKIIIKPYIPKPEPPVICLVTPPHNTYKPEPPVICLVTPPHPGIGQEPTSIQRHSSQGKRFIPIGNCMSRPVFKCKNCQLKPKSGACFDCFSVNYYYTPPVANNNCSIVSENTSPSLRDRLRDLFGESDISD